MLMGFFYSALNFTVEMFQSGYKGKKAQKFVPDFFFLLLAKFFCILSFDLFLQILFSFKKPPI